MGCLKVEMPPSRVLFNSLSVLSFLNLSAHPDFIISSLLKMVMLVPDFHIEIT